MTYSEISPLPDACLDHVVGGDGGGNGVIAGPNGEGCTEPQVPTKPGQEINLGLPV